MLVTIFDTNGSAVIDSIGAQLISYKDSTGKEYIWQRDPKFWNRCSPLLFPIVGNCRNNKTHRGGDLLHRKTRLLPRCRFPGHQTVRYHGYL